VTGWWIYQPASRGDFGEVGELDAFECDVNDLRGIPDISASSPQANGQHAGQGKEGQSERVRAFECVDSRLGTRTICAVGQNVNLLPETRADGEAGNGRGDVVSLGATMVIVGVRRRA